MKHLIKEILFLLICILTNLNLFATQSSFDESDFRDLVINKWGMDDGMPASFIYDLQSSPDGFIWLATTRGLSKFDGSKFNNYNDMYIEGLARNEFTCLDINSSNKIIAGTSNSGIVEFENGKFKHINVSDDAIKNIIRDIKFIDDDNYLIATQSGLFLSSNNVITEVDSTLDNIPIFDIFMSEEGKYYLAATTGVLVYDNKFHLIENESMKDPELDFTRKVFIDSKDNIWIASNKKLMLFQNGKYIDKLFDLVVHRIAEDASGKIWIATNNGLFIIEGENTFNLLKEDGLADRRIRSIWIEKTNGTIWIGTYDGLNSINTGLIKTIDRSYGIANDQIRALIENHNGDIWIGTNGSGLYKYYTKNNTVEQVLYKKGFESIWSLYLEADGTLWAGSEGKIAKLQNDEFKIYDYSNYFEEAVKVIVPSKRRDGYLILGTDKGSILLTNGDDLLQMHSGSRIKDTIHKIYLSEDETMYIGTQVGLFIFNYDKSKQLTVADGLPSNSIRSIYVDKDSTIWLGTNGGGLVRFDGKDFFTFSIKDGLFSKDIWNIVVDKENNFWMSCDEGIYVVNKKNLEDYRNGLIESLTCLSFGKQEGMKNLECTTASKGSLIDKNDNVWFSTMNGAIWFNPKDLLQKPRTFTIYIEKIIADGNIFITPSEVNLTPDTENIEIHYGILHFGNMSGLEYKYQLENYNKNWISSGKRNTAYFTQLPARSYSFHLKANLGFNKNSSKKVSVEFNRPPAIWETDLFNVLLILSGLGLIFLFIRYRNKSVNRRNKELLDEIKKREAAEKSLIESEEKYRRLFDNSAFGIYRSTMDGRFLTANQAALNILGFKSFEELSNIQISNELYASKKARDYFISVLMQNGSVYDFEHEIFKKDGKKITIREAARLVKDESNNIIIEGGFEDVTKKNEYEKAIINAKEKAEKSDQIKSEFLAQMSHEIRTPVNTILSFNSLIKQELTERDRELFKDYFTSIDSGSKRLIRTIDSILNLSQLQSGSYEVIKSKLDLNQICSEIYSEFKKQAGDKGVKLFLRTSDTNPIVLGDHYSVAQMIVNLVDNAIKYTPAGKVEILIKNNGNSQQIEVQDTGIGISDEFINNLYEPFTQEETGYSRKFEGTGLGLTLVKYYADLNNASLDVTSKKNIGTTFRVTFQKESETE